MPSRCTGLAALLLLGAALPLRAEGLAPVTPQGALQGAPRGTPQGIAMQYAVEAAGLTVMQVQAQLSLDADRYRLVTDTQVRGVVRLFNGGTLHTEARGGWRGNGAAPRSYRTSGTWRGERRLTQLEFSPDGLPVVDALVPPREPERQPVPPERLRGVGDLLSAVVGLAHEAERTGRCDARDAVFDGRRRSEFVVRTAGLQRIQAGIWSGEALRCDFTTRITDGLMADDASAAEPHPGSLWLARPVPGGPLVPVRLDTPSRWFGTVSATLEAAKPVP